MPAKSAAHAFRYSLCLLQTVTKQYKNLAREYRIENLRNKKAFTHLLTNQILLSSSDPRYNSLNVIVYFHTITLQSNQVWKTKQKPAGPDNLFSLILHNRCLIHKILSSASCSLQDKRVHWRCMCSPFCSHGKLKHFILDFHVFFIPGFLEQLRNPVLLFDSSLWKQVILKVLVSFGPWCFFLPSSLFYHTTVMSATGSWNDSSHITQAYCVFKFFFFWK